MATESKIDEARAAGFRVTRVMVLIDELGTVIDARENGHPLQYELGPNKRMDDGTTALRSNPCTWRKRHGRWRCL